MAAAPTETEIVVIGAGPGGYPAAFAAADHGKKVVLVNDEPKGGGVCLNRGCIPSKALLHIAKLINESREAAHCGLTFAEPKLDLAQLRTWKGEVVGKLTGGINELCKARGVTYVHARGAFSSSNTLTLTHPDGTKSELKFEKAIIATGSVPAMPAIFKKNDPRVMDSTGALELESVPAKLLVVGGGYIGLEMGTVYAALGSKVTVVEMTANLLPGADRDLVRPLQKRLEGQFEKILVNTKVDSLDCTPAGVVAKLTGPDGKTVAETFDKVLISIGRRPVTQGLGLEKTKAVVTDKGFIQIDKACRTNDPNLYAIGDVAGEPMLAHKATREAKVAVEAILGHPAEFDNVAIPAVVFTDPEIAWCGITETEAAAQKRDVLVAKFPWAASGRAQTLARTEGLTKLICEPGTQRVLGVGIVGPGAGEMIAEAVIAVETAAVARDLADSIHAHPTLSETLMEAAESILGQATHVYRPKRAGV
jgi:dihydrolipoamide dehydrogenase